jgi:adenosine deaminase
MKDQPQQQDAGNVQSGATRVPCELAEKIKQAIIAALKNNTKEMEGYSYFGSNPGVSEDDYEEVADEVIKALQGEQP